MFCPNCGSKIYEEEQFCKYCGAKLNKNIYNFNNENNNYSIVSDEDLIKAYVGDNYEKISNNSFSLPTFFLGIFYFLYRKMYLYSFFLFLGFIISSILFDNYIYIIEIVISILLSINFSKIYMSFVKKKVNKIKIENGSKDNNELLVLCKKKGGTSIASVLITFFSFFIIIIFILSFIVFYELFDESSSSSDVEEKIKNNNQLQYEIPEEFVRSNYNSDNFKIYNYTDDNDYCSISISIHDSYFKQTAKDYLKSHINSTDDDNVSDIESLKINGNKWEYVKIESSYKNKNRLLTIFDNTIYDVEYTIYKDESKFCSTQYEKFINSLNFGKNNKDFNTI